MLQLNKVVNIPVHILIIAGKQIIADIFLTDFLQLIYRVINITPKNLPAAS